MLKVMETIPAEMGEAIAIAEPLRTIAEDIIRNGTVYCIRHCLREDAIDSMRQRIIEYYRAVPQVKISYDGPASAQNYHSLEKGVSPLQKSLHYFHAYVFNAIDELPAELVQVKALFASLAGLYNALTAQRRPLSGAHEDGKRFRPQVFQYPAGGGMFAAHKHALEPQKIGLILGFSKRGRDFMEGGAGFEAPDGTIIDTGGVQDIGDIVLFRYDMKHWVSPCDIHSKLDDAKSNGRWSAVLPIY